jgi:hypothetical protein
MVASSGEWVCGDCGLVKSAQLEGQLIYQWELRVKTYKRLFYFNERCSRWTCQEPAIEDAIFEIIRSRAAGYFEKGIRPQYTKKTISKILKSVNLPLKIQKKYRSKKFKKNLLTNKRFYDKYFEKWKTIIWRLSGDVPNLPDPELVDLIKKLFSACQIPFDKFRHTEDCDGRYGCSDYFDCQHNFINYDFTIRKLLQIAEIKFGFKGCYERFKSEFNLVSSKIREEKLRPLFFKICEYNRWPKVSDE